jgi:hypothetical protein
MHRRAIFLAALAAIAACRASTPTPRAAPEAPATTEPTAAAEAPAAPAAPVEASPEPAPPPIATAPAPAAAGAPAAHVTAALKLLPAAADVIIGLDIPRLGTSLLGERFKAALFADPATLPAACQALAAKDYGAITLAAGRGTLVGVSSGTLTEQRMVPCLQAMLKSKGGAIATKKIAGRKVYYAVGSADDNGWTAWTKAGVPVLATSEAAMAAALDPRSPKVDADLVALANRADHTHAAWIAGRVEADHLAALGVPPDLVISDVRFYGWLDHATDLRIDAVLTLASPADATALEAKLRHLLAPVRELPDVAPLLEGLQLGAHGPDLHVVLALDAAATAALVAQLNVAPP